MIDSVVYIGLGSNLGDRQANLAEAIHQLGKKVRIERVSSCYETEPAYVEDQPRFVNGVVKGRTMLSPEDLLRFTKYVEQSMGRQPGMRNGPRLIDLDILFYGDEVLDTPDLVIPHPRLAQRHFVLVPLAEIAPGLVHPVLQRTVDDLLAHAQDGLGKVVRCLRDFTPRLENDLQVEEPLVRVGIDRVGITGLKQFLHVLDSGCPTLIPADLDIFVRLDPSQRGVHMSRLACAVKDVSQSAFERVNGRDFDAIESALEQLARQLVSRQPSTRSEVHVRIQRPLARQTPVTHRWSQETYTWISIMAATPDRVAQIKGVEVSGMAACPCAQDMVRAYAGERLMEEGIDSEIVEKALDIVPLATHNQKGYGTLLIGSDTLIPAEGMVQVVEASMSSEINTVLKRPDELFVVAKAHRHPRFVEDIVREMLRNALDRFPDLLPNSFLYTKQVNYETIHNYHVCAERSGTVAEIRQEMEGGQPLAGTTMEVWLDRQLSE